MRIALVLVAVAALGGSASANVSGSVGVGIALSPFQWKSAGDSSFGSGGEVSDYATMGGFDVDFDIFVGAHVSPRLTLGVVIGAGVVGELVDDELGDTTLSAALQADLGLRAVLRSSDHTYGFSAGAAIASFSGSELTIGAFDNVVEPETVRGPDIGASIGWTSLALELRASYLVGAHLTYVPIVLTVRVLIGGS